MKNFIDFIREQGVVGLAVGFVLGGATSKLVTALVNDLINPIIGLGLGAVGNLKDQYLTVGRSKIMWGDFTSTLIDTVIISLVIYVFVKKLKLDRLDKKKV